MKKIGEFIYPWGNGHYSRMMRLNDALNEIMDDQLETHFFSKDEIIESGSIQNIILESIKSTA